MQVTLSNGTTLTSSAASSTAALIIRQAFNIPIDDSLSDPEASKAFALKLIESIGQPWFDEAVARAIVQVFPEIDRCLVWYQDPSKSVPHSISGLPIEDLLRIAFVVVSEGTAAIGKIDTQALQQSIVPPDKDESAELDASIIPPLSLHRLIQIEMSGPEFDTMRSWAKQRHAQPEIKSTDHDRRIYMVETTIGELDAYETWKSTLLTKSRQGFGRFA